MAGFVPIRKKDAQRISRPFHKLSFASRRGIPAIPEEDNTIFTRLNYSDPSHGVKDVSTGLARAELIFGQIISSIDII